jgi:hypothetical protein
VLLCNASPGFHKTPFASALCHQAELEAAARSGGSMVDVELPDGSTLHAPLGQEEVEHPAGTGIMYQLMWAQDEAGRLVVLQALPTGARNAGRSAISRIGQQQQSSPAAAAAADVQHTPQQLQQQQQYEELNAAGAPAAPAPEVASLLQ